MLRVGASPTREGPGYATGSQKNTEKKYDLENSLTETIYSIHNLHKVPNYFFFLSTHINSYS